MTRSSKTSVRVVLLGKPGSGKGTQAALLAERLGAAHLSSGAILRNEITERTPFGKQVEEYVLRGEIGPQELIAAVILGHIERHRYGDAYILDGFPRTVYQARELEARFPPARCILLSVPDDILVRRLAGRLTCSRCGAVFHESDADCRPDGVCARCGGTLRKRADDDTDAIRKRLAVFRTDVEPVIRYYRRTGRLAEIDGTRRISVIHNRILRRVP